MADQTLHIELTVPQGWHELTDKELHFVYSLFASEMPIGEVQTICLFKWAGLKVISKYGDDAYLCQHNKNSFVVTAEQIAPLLLALDWLGQMPQHPIRLSKIKKNHALAANFQGVSFETFICCDNLFQGVLYAQRNNNEGLANELLIQIAEILYPTPKPPKRFSEAHVINIFYWFASLKDYLSATFPDFLKPTGSDESDNLLGNHAAPSPKQLQDAMNAQIRALTKGDITKERDILAADTWRALAELNAQAKEYEKLQAELKK